MWNLIWSVFSALIFSIKKLIHQTFCRYVDYFAGLLSHHIKINAAPLFLTHVTVLGTPSLQHGGCKAFIKLYEGHSHVYTSGK